MPVATIIGRRSQMGKTIDKVRCSCGVVTEVYRWSWAGHGKARCEGCRSWIAYGTLEVTHAQTK